MPARTSTSTSSSSALVPGFLLLAVEVQAEGVGQAGVPGVGEPDGSASRRTPQPVALEQAVDESGAQGAGEVVSLL